MQEMIEYIPLKQSGDRFLQFYISVFIILLSIVIVSVIYLHLKYLKLQSRFIGLQNQFVTQYDNLYQDMDNFSEEFDKVRKRIKEIEKKKPDERIKKIETKADEWFQFQLNPIARSSFTHTIEYTNEFKQTTHIPIVVSLRLMNNAMTEGLSGYVGYTDYYVVCKHPSQQNIIGVMIPTYSGYRIVNDQYVHVINLAITFNIINNIKYKNALKITCEDELSTNNSKFNITYVL
jgi:hypothetical protein